MVSINTVSAHRMIDTPGCLLQLVALSGTTKITTIDRHRPSNKIHHHLEPNNAKVVKLKCAC